MLFWTTFGVVVVLVFRVGRGVVVFEEVTN